MNRRNISTVLMGAVVASASAATQTALPARTPGFQYPEYPQSPEELAAGITPSNYNYPPLNVLRYGAVGDGKSDDAAAFNRLFAVAKVAGGTCMIPAPSSHYLVTQPLNCALTGRGANAGFNVQMQANPHFSANDPRGSIFAKHRQSAIFDCTGNNAIQFYDLCISTDTSDYPATCFLCARNSFGASLVQRFNNCRVFGHFSVAVYYNYGSEDDQLVGCFFANYCTAAASFQGTQAAKVCVWTVNNIAGLSSPYASISRGPQSCLHHQVVGGDFMYAGEQSTADVFYLEESGFVSLLNVWAAASSGRSIVFGDSTHAAACSNTSIFGLEVENGAAPAYGLYCPNPASGSRTIESLHIRNSYFSAVEHSVLSVGDRVNITRAYLDAISASRSAGLNIPSTLSYSLIACDTMPLAIAVSRQNKLIGSIQNWNIGSHAGDSWSDCRPEANRTWIPGTRALTVSGALSITNAYHCIEGSVIDVMFEMQATGSISCAAGALITDLPFKPTRPGGLVSICDAHALSSLGLGFIDENGIHLPAIAATNHAITVHARYFFG